MNRSNDTRESNANTVVNGRVQELLRSPSGGRWSFLDAPATERPRPATMPSVASAIAGAEKGGLESEGPPPRKDEYPPSVYSSHISDAIKRGDQVFSETHKYLVPFEPDFNEFVAKVAVGLAPYITYRSDGGRYARGLVRDSEEIKEIHKRFLMSSVAKGTKIRLEATIWRRKSAFLSGRWALLVHFAADILTLDVERVSASPSVVGESKKKHGEKVLRLAVLVAQNIGRQNDKQGDRLTKVVKMANRLGYPRCLELWYYAPDHVRVYLDLRTTNGFRRKMTAGTGGKLPFNGWITQSSPEGWRQVPFAKIIKQCVGHDDTTCHALVNNGLLEADQNIVEAIGYANRSVDQYSLGGGSALGPLAAQFIEHLASLQASPDNLLAAYKR